MSHSVARRLRSSAILLGSALVFSMPLRAAPRAITVVDGDGKPLADAVVAVLLRGARSNAAAGVQADMTQRNRSFDPAVLVVQTGTPVNFPNLDTVRHHVYSFSPAKTFELKLYSGTPAAPVVFDKPGVAVLGCNIHDRMAAWIIVVDTPLHAKTDTAGRVELDLPDGEHRMKLWHASLREAMQEQPLKLDGATRELRVAVVRP